MAVLAFNVGFVVYCLNSELLIQACEVLTLGKINGRAGDDGGGGGGGNSRGSARGSARGSGTGTDRCCGELEEGRGGGGYLGGAMTVTCLLAQTYTHHQAGCC